MEEKKMKSPPLTTFEKGILLRLVKQRELIIENKRTDAVTVAQKKRGWTEISKEFNASINTIPRSGRQLKKCWLNLKQRARKERLIQEINATGGGESYTGIDPFVEIPDTSVSHVDLNCSSELKSDDFVVVNDVMDVVEFDNVCIKEEPQKYLLQEEQELDQEDLLQYQKQREPPQHQQQCQQDKSSMPRPQRRESEFKRQHSDCRNPEALSQCLQIISRHDEKCACALHMLRMKFEEEKLQTEHEFWEEKLRTERELREERKHTERELRQKQLQTEDLRQKHLAELHELEIKERILKIHFLQERLRKS